METNKSPGYFMLCMLTTHYLLVAAVSPAPLDDCQSLKNLLYHIQNSSGEKPAPPLLKLSPISHPFQQIIGTELFNIFLTFRPCLLPSNTEEITETTAPSSLLRITLGRQEAVVIKQSKRLPSVP